MNDAEQVGCYHCGLPVADPARWTVLIQQQTRPMCCPACQAVASAIVAGGFDHYYRFRTENAERASLTVPSREEHYRSCDDPAAQATFVRPLASGEREVRLAVEGIHCAACCWLIENALGRCKGVRQVSMNLGSHRALLRWDPDATSLGILLRELDRIGYRASPLRKDLPQDIRDQARRQEFLRLGVAAMVMMQAGMFSFAIYSGDFTGISQEHRRLLQVFGWIMTLPVMFYSAVPFFHSAWQSLSFGYKGIGHLGMDVPVSLALIVAFAASTHATFTGEGHVYFDSISMFVFLLLLARYAESSARQHFFSSEVASLLPLRCRVCVPGQSAVEEKNLAEVQAGDRVHVYAGEVIPFDGEVISGTSYINESAFSGESLPVEKKPHSLVYAGTVNGENPLQLRVLQRSGEARLDVITHLAEQGEARKPAIANLADRIGQRFTAIVLLIACVAALYWSWRDPSQILPVVIAVLVVSCPCALSLAIPSALAFCFQSLRQKGLWVLNGELPERLRNISVVVFDKTGTLTQGEFHLQKVQLTDAAVAMGYTREDLTEIAAALEQGTVHPLATAFRAIATDLRVEAFSRHGGLGVSGRVLGKPWRLGARSWCESFAGQEWQGTEADVQSVQQTVFLATEEALLARFVLQDQCRDDAGAVISQLKSSGKRVMMLSGDSSGAAELLAKQMGIDECHAGVSPERKLEIISRLQQEGHGVMMVGDGINDIPVLARADVSIAMNRASDLAKLRADAILLQEQLSLLPVLLGYSARVRAVIRQNLFWALLYNGLSLPAAALGYVPPWVAAIGMSASSLLVTFNSLRLRKVV